MAVEFVSHIEHKPVLFELSKSALRQLGRASSPVYIGLELYFSCLVKKMIVSFDTPPEREVFCIRDSLHVYFRPVQSKACNIHDLIGTNSPTLIDFSVVKRRALIPDWVYLDYKKGKWKGDFSWRPRADKMAAKYIDQPIGDEVIL